ADMAVLLGNDGLMRLQLSLRGETGVLLGQADDGNQLLPASEGDVATMVMAYLAQGGEPLKRAVALNLSQQAFLLLLAAADAYKTSYLEDVLKHTVSAANLTAKSLARAVAEAYESTDLRWLLPFALFRLEAAPKLDVTSALAELAEVGLIEAEGVVLTEEGALFIDDLMYRKAIADVTSLYVQDAALARSQVMFIRTEQTLWAVQFGDNDAAIRSLSIDEACELMVSLLIQKDEPTVRSAPQAESPAGAKTEVINCSKCGQRLAPGTKFCIHCGTPAPQPSSPKAAVFCKYCGAKLVPGKHFCTKCGKPCE
ncbi:MAG: hypothetical protein CVU92_11435, partial [Firmicutes bacterium HGW-Firmicutes-17]